MSTGILFDGHLTGAHFREPGFQLNTLEINRIRRIQLFDWLARGRRAGEAAVGTAVGCDGVSIRRPEQEMPGILIAQAAARRLILKKIYDIARAETDRYLNAEKRGLVRAVENLWEKYAMSSRQLEEVRGETLKTLEGFLSRLKYLK